MRLPNDPFAKPENAPKPLYIVPFYTLREAKIAALEIAQTCYLSFDNRRFTISFPAFDLKFTNYIDNALHGCRNVVDVAELDKLLLKCKERISHEHRVQ